MLRQVYAVERHDGGRRSWLKYACWEDGDEIGRGLHTSRPDQQLNLDSQTQFANPAQRAHWLDWIGLDWIEGLREGEQEELKR